MLLSNTGGKRHGLLWRLEQGIARQCSWLLAEVRILSSTETFWFLFPLCSIDVKAQALPSKKLLPGVPGDFPEFADIANAQNLLKNLPKLFSLFAEGFAMREIEPQNPDFCPGFCKWTWWPQRWGTSWQITTSHSCPFRCNWGEKVVAYVCQLKILWSLTQNGPWLWASVSSSENFDLTGFEHCKMDVMSSYGLRRGCESSSERGNNRITHSLLQVETLIGKKCVGGA